MSWKFLEQLDNSISAAYRNSIKSNFPHVLRNWQILRNKLTLSSNTLRFIVDFYVNVLKIEYLRLLPDEKESFCEWQAKGSSESSTMRRMTSVDYWVDSAWIYFLIKSSLLVDIMVLKSLLSFTKTINRLLFLRISFVLFRKAMLHR